MSPNGGVVSSLLFEHRCGPFFTYIVKSDETWVEINTALALAYLYDDPTPKTNNFEVSWNWREHYE